MKTYYFDYNSTTPVMDDVQNVILDTMKKFYGNPSNLHKMGREAREILENSRKNVADLIGAGSNEIYFTASGTEANNLALKGLIPFYKKGKNHIITSISEHSSVFETAQFLKKEGIELTVLDVDSQGCIDPEELKNSIKSNTGLISIMTANNETGVIQDIAVISKIARSRGILFHTDAVQAAGKIPINVNDPQVDLLSLSAHKLYGPKGVGALYVRRGISVAPVQHGGGQEHNIRSGTENIPDIAGFGEACRISMQNYENDSKHIMHLKNLLYTGIGDKIKCFKLNGSIATTLPNTLNISFPGCESDTLILDLDSAGFYVSAGSACNSSRRTTSRVLKAMKLKPAEMYSSIRFSLGRDSKEKEVMLLVNTLSEIVGQFV